MTKKHVDTLVTAVARLLTASTQATIAIYTPSSQGGREWREKERSRLRDLFVLLTCREPTDDELGRMLP